MKKYFTFKTLALVVVILIAITVSVYNFSGADKAAVDNAARYGHRFRRTGPRKLRQPDIKKAMRCPTLRSVLSTEMSLLFPSILIK